MRVAESTPADVDLERLSAAMGQAVRLALLDHKRTGHPIAVWRDGAVAWIAPEDIQVDDE